MGNIQEDVIPRRNMSFAPFLSIFESLFLKRVLKDGKFEFPQDTLPTKRRATNAGEKEGKVKVYTDEDWGGNLGIGVTDDKKTVIIFDTVEGEAPFKIHKDGACESFDYETAPEEVASLMDAANEIIAEGKEKSLAELPKETRAILKGHIPDEFLEIPE